jgi:MacB-like periplasmic core domain
MNIWNDIRFGARTLRKSPAFTLTAVVTLALGIGGTTAIYSVCDALLWKPVPHLDFDRLTMVLVRVPDDPNGWNSLAPADFEDVRRQNTPFESLIASQIGRANIVGGSGEPQRVTQFLVTSNFFDVLNVRPALGRGFAAGEDQPGHEREVVLGDNLWRRQFGADPAIVGGTIRLDDEDYTVIGVMPRRFAFPWRSPRSNATPAPPWVSGPWAASSPAAAPRRRRPSSTPSPAASRANFPPPTTSAASWRSTLTNT